jgi:phosphonate transport system permease protein
VGHAGEHGHGLSRHADRQRHRRAARVSGCPQRAADLAVPFPHPPLVDFLRGVDALVWALVFVRAVGLGPLAGVLAIANTDIGILSKLFAEAIENVDRKQVDGVRATGAGSVQTMRFGVIPQVLPIMISNAPYMFESNSRSATILGIVGAGGIGFHLSDRIRAHRWEEVGFIILMIIVVVALIDFISHLLRSRLINEGTNRPLVQEKAG